MKDGQIRINSLTAKDSGVYTCSARSGLVQVETEVQLIVKTGKQWQITNAEKYTMFNLGLRQKKCQLKSIVKCSIVCSRQRRFGVRLSFCF